MEERNFCDEPKTMAVIHMLIHLALGNQYVKSAKKTQASIRQNGANISCL